MADEIGDCDGSGITPPPGGAGVRGWLSGIYQRLGGTLNVNVVSGGGSGGTTDVTDRTARLLGHVNVDSSALPTGAAQDGTDGTGITAPTGAAGIRGWLSGIYNKLNTSIAVTGTFWQATQPVSGTVTANAGTGTLNVLAKKDTGRSQVHLSWEEMAGTAAAESALTNFTVGSAGGSALSAATSYTVTAGKTLRIQSVTVYIKATSTVTNLGKFRIRNAASSIANTSPVVFNTDLVGSSAGAVTAGGGTVETIPIPGGLEVTGQITFTWNTSANTCTVGMSITGYEY